MTSKINASTSGAGGVITTADNSGILELQSGGTTIATISSTGLQTNVGAPAFSAYQSAATSLPNNTATKILFGTENFDTNNNFASSTFTPTVAGYYQVTGKVAFSANGTNSRWVALYKNGTKVADIAWTQGNSTNFAEVSGGYLISMNGTTDYLELYAYQNSGSTLNTDGGTGTYFQAFLARSA